jgi:hypothetical protein
MTVSSEICTHYLSVRVVKTHALNRMTTVIDNGTLCSDKLSS